MHVLRLLCICASIKLESLKRTLMQWLDEIVTETIITFANIVLFKMQVLLLIFKIITTTTVMRKTLVHCQTPFMNGTI